MAGLAALLALTACASEPVDDGSGRPINFPDESAAIDLGDTDLAVPLASPLEISAVSERVSEGQVFENIYAFHQVKGYLRTSRVVFGYFSDRTAASLRHQGFFEGFAGDLSIPPGDGLELGPVERVAQDDPRIEGYYAFAASPPYHDRCFVARVGYLLVDYTSVPPEEDSVDTIIEVFLCGDLPPERVLLDFLAEVNTVEDRDAYRRELSKRAIGTI